MFKKIDDNKIRVDNEVIVSTSSKTGITKQGPNAGKPYTMISVSFENNGATFEASTFKKEYIMLEGQEVSGDIIKNAKGYWNFYKDGETKPQSYAQSNDSSYGPDATLLSKLNEILGILHAHFPTASDMVDKKPVDEPTTELVEEEIQF